MVKGFTEYILFRYSLETESNHSWRIRYWSEMYSLFRIIKIRTLL